MRERVRLGDIRAARADRDHQLHLVMQVLGHRRIGHVGPAGDQRVGGLGEEEGQLAIGIGAHLARVLGIVAADAEDAANRERAAPLHRHGDDLGRLDHVVRHGGTSAKAAGQ